MYKQKREKFDQLFKCIFREKLTNNKISKYKNSKVKDITLMKFIYTCTMEESVYIPHIGSYFLINESPDIIKIIILLRIKDKSYYYKFKNTRIIKVFRDVYDIKKNNQQLNLF